MIFAQTKIIWGFVEKNSIRVENYRVTIAKDGKEISTLTNASGFYQLNIGNITNFSNGDIFFIEVLGDINFFGETSIVLSGGTTTQQAITITVQQDLTPPIIAGITPSGYSNSAYPIVNINISDLESEPDFGTLNLIYNSTPIVGHGELVNPDYEIEPIFTSRKTLTVLVKNLIAFPDGMTVILTGDIQDKVHNITAIATSFKIDLDPPTIFSFDPLPNSFVTDIHTVISVTLADTISGIDPNSLQMTVDGTVYDLSDDELSFNSNVLQFTPSIPFQNSSVVGWSIGARDLAGNSLLPFSSCFAILATKPIISNVSPTKNSFTNIVRPNISFEFIPGSSPIDLFSFGMTIDGNHIFLGDIRLTLSSMGGFFAPDYDLSGTVNISIGVQDSLGLRADLAWSFGIDTTPPIIVPFKPINDGYVSSQLANLFFKITDNESLIDANSITIAVNDVLNEEIVFSNSYAVFAPSTPYHLSSINTATVNAKDSAGNSADQLTVNFYVDADAPHVFSVNPPPGSSVNDKNQTITIGIEDDQSGIDPKSIAIKINNIEFKPGDPGFLFDGQFIKISPTNPWPNTTIIVELAVSDLIGNRLKRTVTNFDFDFVPLSVASVSPQNFVPIKPDFFQIRFNKKIDTSTIVFGEDVLLESRDVANDGVFVVEPIDLNVSNVDPISMDMLNMVPVDGFKINFEYRLILTNAIKDITGNQLNPDVYVTAFILYQPGDLLIRNTIGISDLAKYAKFVLNFDDELVSLVDHLADLNGDGLVDSSDVVLLQSIVLGEKNSNDIIIGGTVPIKNRPIPSQAGFAPTIQVSGFPTTPLAEITEGLVSLPNANNIIGFQADLIFDPDVLMLLDMAPLVDVSIFRYAELSPGKIRILMLSLSGKLTDDIIRIKFLVIGSLDPLIDLSNIELVGSGQKIIIPGTIVPATFYTDTINVVVTQIHLDANSTLVPSDGRETTITAVIQNAANAAVPVEGIPLEWSVIGNGYMLEAITTTDPSGASKNTVHLSGPPASNVRVSAKIKFDTISGTSEPIQVFNGTALEMRIETQMPSIGTGEPLQLTVFVKNVDNFEFQTTDVTWISDSNAVVSKTGEFVAFVAGQYRVTAILNSNPSVSAISNIIIVTSIMEFLDCDDNPIRIDTLTGLAQLDLGSLFAGNTTGTQEIKIKNTLKSYVYPMENDVILDVAKSGTMVDLITEFSPIIYDTIQITKRSSNGKIQFVALKETNTEEISPAIKMANTHNGIATIYLKYVNVYDVGVFNCGPNSCIGRTARLIFINQKDVLDELVDDGDYVINEKLGQIFLKISDDADFPGKIAYKVHRSAIVNFDNGEIHLIDTDIVTNTDILLANYKFMTGKIGNISIAVSPNADTLISADGISFGKSLMIDALLPEKTVRFYVLAETATTEAFGSKSSELFVEAEIFTARNCV